MHWLDEPAAGTAVCLGYDGADVNDWAALKAETFDGLSFTPRFGPSRLPTIWNPETFPGHRIDRTEVSAALSEVMNTFRVERFYYDPPRWETDGEQWATEHGEQRVIPWPTYRTRQMHAALERVLVDLGAGRMTQDGCPLTAEHVANARMKASGGGGIRYVLEKPNDNQKIDIAMAMALAHEAASDARAAGWTDKPPTRSVVVSRRR